MTLKRSPRLLVDIDDLAVGVARKIHTDFDHDLRHLLVDLGLEQAQSLRTQFQGCGRADLLLRLGPSDVWLELARDRGHLAEEPKLAFIERLGLARQRHDHSVGHVV